MTERVITALRGLGIEASPLAVLEGEEAFFALLGDLLIYQDGQGTRRVTLRDLTRIRSDADGLLRVETPAGTALTASLLGFEPSQVQGFFAEVRDATARAKNLPPAPLPTAGGFKTFGSAPAASAAAPTPPPVPTPSDAKPNLPGPAEVEAVNSGAIEAEPAKAELTQANRPRPEPIKLGGAKQAQENRQAQEKQNRTKPRLEVQTAEPAAPLGARLESSPAKVTVVQADPRPQAAAALATPPVTPPAAPPSPSSALPAEALEVERPAPKYGRLAARAAAVGGLPSRLQVLAAVLGLAAIGLAFFQYQGGAPLNGLWTLIAGGVGSVALFVFADVTRLIVALANEVAGGQAAGAAGDADDVRP